jgi:hypothetical protein
MSSPTDGANGTNNNQVDTIVSTTLIGRDSNVIKTDPMPRPASIAAVLSELNEFLKTTEKYQEYYNAMHTYVKDNYETGEKINDDEIFGNLTKIVEKTIMKYKFDEFKKNPENKERDIVDFFANVKHDPNVPNVEDKDLFFTPFKEEYDEAGKKGIEPRPELSEKFRNFIALCFGGVDNNNFAFPITNDEIERGEKLGYARTVYTQVPILGNNEPSATATPGPGTGTSPGPGTGTSPGPGPGPGTSPGPGPGPSPGPGPGPGPSPSPGTDPGPTQSQNDVAKSPEIKNEGTPLYPKIRDYLLKFIKPQWERIKETRKTTPYAKTPEGEKDAKKLAILGLGAGAVFATASAFGHNGGKKKGGKSRKRKKRRSSKKKKHAKNIYSRYKRR